MERRDFIIKTGSAIVLGGCGMDIIQERNLSQRETSAQDVLSTRLVDMANSINAHHLYQPRMLVNNYLGLQSVTDSSSGEFLVYDLGNHRIPHGYTHILVRITHAKDTSDFGWSFNACHSLQSDGSYHVGTTFSDILYRKTFLSDSTSFATETFIVDIRNYLQNIDRTIWFYINYVGTGTTNVGYLRQCAVMAWGAE